MKHIVIIHAGGVGDLVLTLPALAAIRRAWPAAALTLIGRPERTVLARMAGVADRCVDLDTCGLWRLGLGGAPAPAVLRDADLVVDFLAKGPPPAWWDFLRGRGGRTQVVAIDPLPPPDYHKHASTWICTQVAAGLRIDAAPAPPEIRVTEAATDAARRRLGSSRVRGPFVAIHPGSGSIRKNWPADRFAAIAERLREEARRQVVWLAGPAELERRTLPPDAGPEAVLRDLTLEEVAGLLALADAYVGNDSGISHLAAAVRRPDGRATPTVVLFGPTDRRVWAPRGPHVRLVASTDRTMEAIGVEQVWGEIRPHAGRGNATTL
jgi:ADP-heptose:LPS heptosyltransferase